ncbi:nitroreductase/quinone reductase family protein [Pseudonocardia sp. N23]|uniref:nitroreductase/quinone reductase family protein n=1 Tax=Pseudonocardia sp. N23 TaxID=1987376 RepID=UPI000BFC3323|nr:nitroreductase/quinone reductase family protein [Pseudonocardia sp. N23]GAY10012.1 hypothetical protein TOK_4368 [Pseudonocardia sp. N23]
MAVADDLDRATDSQWDRVAEQTRRYLASDGTEGHETDGVRTLVLVTTGRVSGRPRRTCLAYGPPDASEGGADARRSERPIPVVLSAPRAWPVRPTQP